MNKYRFKAILIIFCCLSAEVFAQSESFSREDTLRGTLSTLRSCYDVTSYTLRLRINPSKGYISGSNTFYFRSVKAFNRMQIDLFRNMQIDSLVFRNQKVDFEREADAVFMKLPEEIPKGKNDSLTCYYSGYPKKAASPPWDGGINLQKDQNGKDWMTVSCEGIGASLWWPCKDHLSDEPDSMRMIFEVPEGLVCISNGNLVRTYASENGMKAFEWHVSYPINSYNVTFNIGDYINFSDTYSTLSGRSFALDYYVIRGNETKARKHFEQVKPMLKCYEKFFGPYPFPKDGYALVETPYWGMEHQGAIAYGNHFKNNEFNFDFIIIHESAHEYWGNSVSCADHAEMWIHEALATYTEALYVEDLYGKDRALKYLQEQKLKIKNHKPMLGPLGVNYEGWGDADIYYKGTWMFHTLRNVINNDKRWFRAIRALADHYKYKVTNTEQVIRFLSRKLKKRLTPFFYQYLKHIELPKFLYTVEEAKKGNYLLRYRLSAEEPQLSMSLTLYADNHPIRIVASTKKVGEKIISKKEAQDLRFPEELFYVMPVKRKDVAKEKSN